MSQFEFISVFVSIVVAIAVAEVLTAWGRVLRHRDRVSHYWLYMLWTVMFVLLMVWDWFTLFHEKSQAGWTYLLFLLVLSRPTVDVLLAIVLAPPDPAMSDSAVDLREYYYDQAPAFFGLGVIYYAAAFSTVVVTKGFDLSTVLLQGLMCAIVWTLARTRRERTHVLLAGAAATLFLEVVVLSRLS